MKLNTFLTESTIEQSSAYKQMKQNGDNNHFDIFLDEYNKHFSGFKLISSAVNDPPVANGAGNTKNAYNFRFSDGLVELVVRYYIRNEKFGSVKCKALLIEKYCAFDVETDSDKLFFSCDWFPSTETGIDSQDATDMKAGAQLLENFSEWYFDISGRYGKVKLIKNRIDLPTSKSWVAADGRFFWTPYLGQFAFNHDLTQASEPRVHE